VLAGEFETTGGCLERFAGLFLVRGLMSKKDSTLLFCGEGLTSLVIVSRNIGWEDSLTGEVVAKEVVPDEGIGADKVSLPAAVDDAALSLAAAMPLQIASASVETRSE
jgi:hypothetical protein